MGFTDSLTPKVEDPPMDQTDFDSESEESQP